jgi:anthranilate phosphoribosyltransferase
MSLRHAVATLGRGPGRSRSLSVEEAEAAMAEIMDGEAAPEAVGALLMLLRMKGESAPEIAGFARAARVRMPALAPVALDWPSYAAGRTRGLPWFLLAARLVAEAGHPVLLHGSNRGATGGGARGGDAGMAASLRACGIPRAASPDEACFVLESCGIAHLPLEALSPGLSELLRLRGVLGLRSCVNTLCRVLNPAGAPAAVQGVFHPPYLALQAEVARLLGQPAVTVVKGGGGEFERTPFKEVHAHGVRAGLPWQRRVPAAIPDEARRMADGPTDRALLPALWAGTYRDPAAEAAVIGTAALALDTLGVADADAAARDLWEERARSEAA